MRHNIKYNNLKLKNNAKFISAIFINGLLTIIQIIAGVFSGSLSLMADALHNFSDMISLVITFVTEKISKKPSDKKRTFSYKRAEIIGAFVNVILLMATGMYLVFEAILRYFHPQTIKGQVVIIVALIALIIDLATALIISTVPNKDLNIKVIFIHNLSDAFTSLGVVLTGIIIVRYQFYIIDSITTLLIAVYVLSHALKICPRIINILMDGVPNSISFDEVVTELEKMKDVKNVHNMHIWSMNENEIALECHIVVNNRMLSKLEKLKKRIKTFLRRKFNIVHSNIEFENALCSEEKH